jgi:hypothetical protein
VGGNIKRNDLARAEDKGLQVTHRIRVLYPDHPGAEDLHRRQIEAMAVIIRRAALRREREARDSGG